MRQLIFQTAAPEKPAPCPMGQTCGARSFSCNARYLERDGAPWLPVMAEFQFARCNAEDWELELRKIKAAGVDIVATYLFWIFHEEREGHFDFSGRRDVSRFLALCQRVGLYAFVRIGPWNHGECRNGGFPDWVQHSGLPLRSCDERYLALVRRLFEAYGREIGPWLFENGGPVIGIQLENELTENAPYLDALRTMAEACGLRVPYYTVTGWGAHVTEYPRGRMLPVFGGYPAAPWTQHCAPLPPSENYFFSPFRNDPVIGCDLAAGAAFRAEAGLEDVPFLTCELGPGVQCTRHRRPVISAMDAAALSWTKLGSGNNLPGYYLFHGGFNPPGGLYQESTATGYPNDLPVSSYDFQAPLGEYGQVRPSYFRLKLMHQFLHCCGDRLAAMAACFPDVMPAGVEDLETPRLALRGGGDGGFLFFNTHQRGAAAAPIRDVMAVIRDSGGSETRLGPLNIPGDCCGAFPIRQTWFGVTVAFLTAIPLWAGLLDGKNTLVCAALDGVEAVLTLDKGWTVECAAPARVEQTGSVTRVLGLRPGRDCAVEVTGETAALRILVLEEADGLRFYPVEQNGIAHAVLSDGIVLPEGERLAVWGMPGGTLCAYPPLPGGLEETGHSGLFTACRLPRAPETERQLAGLRLDPAADRRIGPDNPYAAYLFAPPQQCPEYTLEIPAALRDGPWDVLLEFQIQGGVAQLYAGRELIADEFPRGELWTVGLGRLRPYLAQGLPLRLKCAPLGADVSIYLEREIARDRVEAALVGASLRGVMKLGGGAKEGKAL